jgi:peptidyl-prolyl cis-trans isomerase C
VAGQNLTLDEFKSLLKAYGTTYGEYQQNMRKRLMFEKMMEAQFAEKIPKPTDEQLKAYYDENIQQFHKPEAIHAEHILIIPAKDANDPNKALVAAKTKAQGILKKIKAGGNFEELAKQYSDCPSAKQGGDLGIQPKGNLVPEFEKAAYALKPGQVSDIVQTEFGYHIIKLISHIDANTVTLEQAKDEITDSLAGKQKEKIVMDYIQKIRSSADVKYTDEADKFDLEITGTKPMPPSRKQTENAPTLDESKSAPKDSGESKKD